MMIRRDTRMKQLSYTVKFLTPAFLGNAEQNGQWRTPPFKALLRQWWRVAYAAERRFEVDIAAMRQEEGLLFGHAWLEDDRDDKGSKVAARKSQVRIRLDSTQEGGAAWTTGTQQGVQPLSEGLDTSYAWFGLIKRGNGLPNRSGIKAEPLESVRQLQVAFPDSEERRMREVMSLVHAFGLLGSRSRGGWGALQVDGLDALQGQDMCRYARDLGRCLRDDWAMSLASDDRGLCAWESKIEFDSWDKAMRFIASQRKQVRTALKQNRDLRPALGFALPNGRMPSPLRWKVMAAQPGKLSVRVFALPHRIPDDGGKRLSWQELQVAWQTVSRELDGSHGLQRLR